MKVVTSLFGSIVLVITLIEGQNLQSEDLSQKKVEANSQPDDGSVFVIKQMPRTHIFPPNPPQTPRVRQGGSVSREALRERLESIILILSRNGDRMVAIETKLNQQTERIDNINYRITKLELQGEERKGQLNDVAASIRHRLVTSDNEMDAITDTLSQMKTTLGLLTMDTIDINAAVQLLKKDTIQEEERGPRLQAVMTAVYSVRAISEIVQQEVETLGANFSSLFNATQKLSFLADVAATKKDLLSSFADLKNSVGHNQAAFPMFITGSTETSKGKGEAADCWELNKKRGKTKSGIYKIQPPMARQPFFVYCDMDTDGGGWTVIQSREDGEINFAREWYDYKHGFGNLGGEFWLGNEKIHQITNYQVNELQITLGDFRQRYRTAKYSAFAIGSELESYALRLLGAYSGDAGDSLEYHVGQKWSTIDVDNDEWPNQNCARDHTGAWWYKACDTSNLNGRYLHGAVPPAHEYTGIYWYDFHGPQYSLWKTTMMVRRGNNAITKKKKTHNSMPNQNVGNEVEPTGKQIKNNS